jgi:hypothetical protein
MSAGGYRDVGEYFFGTKGVIETSRRGFTLHPEGKSSSHQETNYNITEDVIAHFVKATRGEAPADNATLFAAESTLTAIMGRIAIDLQREVTWDEVFNM